jgi:hypothetical protein
MRSPYRGHTTRSSVQLSEAEGCRGKILSLRQVGTGFKHYCAGYIQQQLSSRSTASHISGRVGCESKSKVKTDNCSYQSKPLNCIVRRRNQVLTMEDTEHIGLAVVIYRVCEWRRFCGQLIHTHNPITVVHVASFLKYTLFQSNLNKPDLIVNMRRKTRTVSWY